MINENNLLDDERDLRDVVNSKKESIDSGPPLSYPNSEKKIS